MRALLADVGGTSARFTLYEAGEFRHTTTIDCANFASLESAIADFLKKHNITHLERAAVAVAGPVLEGRVILTNLKWTVSRASIASAVGSNSADSIHLVNDFHALALSLGQLPKDELVFLGGASAQNATGNMVVVGPGTGLGAAGLVRHETCNEAVVGEGGHMSASAYNAREWKIIQHIYDGGASHVSWERLLSGYGLPSLHAAICAVDGLSYQPLNAEQIGTHAKNDTDSGCASTIKTFSAMLGSFAGDMALAFGATGGVFIAGGIVPKLEHAFSVTDFRERFEAKGRFKAYLSPIPAYLIKSKYPAFVGLASLVAA
jgi:glucokinase